MLRTTVIVFQPDPIIVRPEWQVKIWPPFSIKTEHHEFKTILINCNFHDLCYNLGQKPHNDGRFSSHISLSPPYPPFNHFLPPSPHLMLFSTIIAGCLAQQYCDRNNTIEWGVRGQLSYTYIIQCTDNINRSTNFWPRLHVVHLTGCTSPDEFAHS